MLGVKLPDDKATRKQETTSVKKGELFGSPEMYEKMTQEEREAADKQLMAKFKRMGLPIKMG